MLLLIYIFKMSRSTCLLLISLVSFPCLIAVGTQYIKDLVTHIAPGEKLTSNFTIKNREIILFD